MLFQRPTERDKQTRVGPSEIGDLCARCLADKLLGIGTKPSNDTPIAPLIGTAFHAYAENLESSASVLVETKVTVGEVEGYGPITGTMDRYDIELKHVIDWKVLGKKKAKEMRSGYAIVGGTVVFDEHNPYHSQLVKYYHQIQMYGKGAENAGLPVESVSLLIIPRDATIERIPQDVTELCFPYNPHVAGEVLARAGRILAWARDNPDSLDEIDSDPDCYVCSYQRLR